MVAVSVDSDDGALDLVHRVHSHCFSSGGRGGCEIFSFKNILKNLIDAFNNMARLNKESAGSMRFFAETLLVSLAAALRKEQKKQTSLN